MRRTTTLVLTLVLVVGGLATAAAATAGATPQGATGTTALDAQTDDDTLRVSEYDVRERTIGPDEPLELTATYRGTGDEPRSTELRATVDGETERIGEATVAPGDEQVEVAAADGWEVRCEFGYDEEDGWYIRCQITIGTAELGPGDHDVGIGDAEPTAVTVLADDASDDGGHDAGDHAAPRNVSYDVVDPTLAGDQPLSLNARIPARAPDDESVSRDLVVTVDGERGQDELHLGTLSVDGDRGTAEFQPTAQGEGIVITVDCEWVDDGHYPYLDCEQIELDPDVLLLAGDGGDGGDSDAASEAGVDDATGGAVYGVGLGDAAPTPVVLTDRLDEKKHDKRAVAVSVADDELAAGEPIELEAIYAGAGDAPATQPIVVEVDGERHRLGTAHLDADAESVAFEDAEVEAAAADGWEVHCEFGYDDEDGWYVTCEITYETAELGPGDHDVGIGGEDPLTVSVAPREEADLTMVRGTVVNETVESGDDLQVRARFEGGGEGVPSGDLAVAVDGETTRLGTLHVDPGAESVTLESAEPAGGVWYMQRRTAASDVDGAGAAAAADWGVHCEFGYDDEAGWYVTCEITYDTADLQPGDHDVGVGDGAASTVTVEEPDAGGLVGRVANWVGDLFSF